MKRTPLQRRTPLRSKRKHEPTVQREPRPMARLQPLARPANYGGSTSGCVVDKEGARQSQPYERAAKALGHCMRCNATGPLDFCHRDMGKGQGIKTDSREGWPGCRSCHEIVGRQLPKPVRRAVELLLGVMTRAAVREAKTWPPRLPAWNE